MKINKSEINPSQAGVSGEPNDLALAPARENLSENKEGEKVGCQQRLVRSVHRVSFPPSHSPNLPTKPSKKEVTIRIKQTINHVQYFSR